MNITSEFESQDSTIFHIEGFSGYARLCGLEEIEQHLYVLNVTQKGNVTSVQLLAIADLEKVTHDDAVIWLHNYFTENPELLTED